jgi:hypothetical protein
MSRLLSEIKNHVPSLRPGKDIHGRNEGVLNVETFPLFCAAAEESEDEHPVRISQDPVVHARGDIEENACAD